MGRKLKWTDDKLDILAKELYSYFEAAIKKFRAEKKCKDIPFISAFCRDVGKLSQETLLVKTKTHDGLSEALKNAKEIQKEILILGGLQGRFAAAAFIFTAKNMTDMRDEQTTNQNISGELTLKRKDARKMTDEEIEDALREASNQSKK